MAEKRRLPVLQASNDEAPPRPPWQWSLFGAGLIVLSWLLLAILSSPVNTFILRANLGATESAEQLAMAAPDVLGRIYAETVGVQLAALLLASVVSGVVVGMWGPGRLLGAAAFAGGLVASAAVLLTAVASRGFSGAWGALLMIPCASAAAAGGAWLGARRKRVLPP